MPNTQCALVGNLTNEPTLRFTNDNLAVLNFSIAVNEGTGEEAADVLLRHQRVA